jgi:uncharacterized protein YuzE
MFHYDDSSDTLYVHFEYPAKSADSKFADKYGEIVLGLNEKGKIVNLTIMNAATYGQQQSTRWVSTSGLICQTGWTSLFFTMFN